MSAEGAGAVTVTYGASGTSQRITQATPGVPDSPELDDRFGQTYTWLDRDRDGCDDLVVGAAWEASAFRRQGGSDDDGGVVLGGVHVFPPGWRPGDPDLWLPDLLGIEDVRGGRLRSSDTRLLLGNTVSCRSVGWPDLLDGGTLQSELSEVDDCAAG